MRKHLPGIAFFTSLTIIQIISIIDIYLTIRYQNDLTNKAFRYELNPISAWIITHDGYSITWLVTLRVISLAIISQVYTILYIHRGHRWYLTKLLHGLIYLLLIEQLVTFYVLCIS